MEFGPGASVTGGTKSMTKQRRNNATAFKARVTLEAIGGEETVTEIAAHPDVHPNQVATCKRQLSENAVAIVGGNPIAADG
jgi:transposase